MTIASALKLWTDESEWRKAYLGLKDLGSFEFETGFNVCSDQSCVGAILQRGSVATKTFTFNDWKGKGLPERTCEELGKCETPAPPIAEEESAQDPAFLYALIMIPLIGLIVLISILVLMARKSKLDDNSSNDLSDRGGIRNPSDDSDELSVNDSRVGGIQWDAGGLIEASVDRGHIRDPEEVKGGIVEIFEDEEVTLPQVDGVYKEIVHLKTIPEF